MRTGGGMNLKANFRFIKALELCRVSRAVWSLDPCLGNDSSIYTWSCLGTCQNRGQAQRSQVSNSCWLATAPLLIPLKVFHLLFYPCLIPHMGQAFGDHTLPVRKGSASPMQKRPHRRKLSPVLITGVRKSEMVMGRVSSCGKSLGKCQSFGKSWEMLVYTALVWLMLCRDNRDSVSRSQHEMALRNRAYLGEKVML